MMWSKRLGDVLTVPIRLAVFPVVGFLCGRALDRWLGIFPWMTLGLLVLGFVAGARDLWMAAKRPDSNDKRS